MAPFVIKTRFPTLRDTKRELGLSKAAAKRVDGLVDETLSVDGRNTPARTVIASTRNESRHYGDVLVPRPRAYRKSKQRLAAGHSRRSGGTVRG